MKVWDSIDTTYLWSFFLTGKPNFKFKVFQYAGPFIESCLLLTIKNQKSRQYTYIIGSTIR